MSPGARRRRSAKRRKLGPTRLQRERTRERKAAARDPRAIRARGVRATFLIDGEEVTFSDAFSGIDRSAAPSFDREIAGWGVSFKGELTAGPLYFTTDHDDLTLWEMFDRHTHHVLGAPRPTAPVTVVPPELYATLAARLAPFEGQRNTPETRLSIGHELHAELDDLLRAGVQPWSGADDRVDALAYAMAHTQRPPRRRRLSVFARVPRLRAELVDLLTTPDGFPFVASSNE